MNNEAGVSDRLRKHYDGYYSGVSEWRRLSAVEKATRITQVCGEVPHSSVIDIGTGDGAVIRRLAETGFASEFSAYDISASAIEALRAEPVRGLKQASVFDGVRLPVVDRCADVALLCHVLEHLEHPRMLLYEAARVAAYTVVEVPLELNSRLPMDFVPNDTGHINVYTAQTIRHLVQSSGLEVLKQVVSNDGFSAYQFQFGRAGVLRYWIKESLLRVAPAFARRRFTYNSTLLCRPSP
jgi:ubiquinone/menaquinone biosynthesis C-methylase UbiE